MDIWESDKLILFIAFAIPGFISIKFYQLFFPGTARPVSEQLIDAVAYSCINYAALFWLIVQVEGSALKEVHIWLYYLFYVFVLFLAPGIWVLAWKWLRTRDIFQRNAPHPIQKPWDFVFKQRRCYWVIVYLKNGEKIAGKFADKSFASSAPAEEQLYLEEVWLESDGILDRPVKQSEGVLIMTSEISRVELLKYQ
ncbi:DUF6338 family protein [Pseudomonas citronellolis]|uniref:DUF6338 family protein n=1 Tax=Pseudomonas citronellolis TaxID=53408 RepID=UPI00226EC092|nr:DUF6338 family protein [Pseudomonas citronellolis]WAB92009.1 DUF6338 family protein [Pseudomonas citronellolis]